MWRTVTCAPAYDVSSEGRVRLRSTGQIACPNSYDSDGYPVVRLKQEGKWRTFKVHHLVLEAFVGPRPDGMECRHLNGIKTDNRAENLTWGTHSENIMDQVRHGTHRQSRKTHCPAGHELNEENTYSRKDRAGLECRICRYDATLRYRKKRKEQQ